MRVNQRLVSTVVVALLLLKPALMLADTTNLNVGQTINLGAVITNNLSIQIGDKVFGGFYFAYNDYGASDIDLGASNVTVKALENNIGFGLEFDEPLSALNTKTKDVTFRYTAEVAAGYNNLISDIDLKITGSKGGAGTGTVSEVAFSDAFGGTAVGHADAFLTSQLEKLTVLDSTEVKLWVEKDVHVSGNSGGPTSFASISAVQQTYSQVPEPSTALLVGLGLLGVVAVKRKRKS